MGKTMERIINNRLQWVLETNRTVNQEQAGFRTHRSTSEHVVKLSQSIKDTLDKKQILTAVFVDFQSAYDKVCKQNLLLKLVRQRTKLKLLSWLELFLTQRSCRVKYGEEYSKNKILQTGLPQGAVISCTLFNIYINDLLDEWTLYPT